MTHRAALVLSIVLTLVVGTGVIAGRDRLFALDSVASSATSTSGAANASGDDESGSLITTTPRIVNVTLPSATRATSESARGERGEHARDRHEDDHHWDDEEDDHDDEDDDD